MTGLSRKEAAAGAGEVVVAGGAPSAAANASLESPLQAAAGCTLRRGLGVRQLNACRSLALDSAAAGQGRGSRITITCLASLLNGVPALLRLLQW